MYATGTACHINQTRCKQALQDLDFAMSKKNVSLKIGKHKSRTGGLTAAGRKKYNAAIGSNLKAPQPEGGPRKRSFCARMSGVKGPMKKPNGKPTRKALALRKWKC